LHRDALHILNRFHIVGHLNKAVDNAIKDAGEPACLKNGRWIFLEKKNRLWGKPRTRLREPLELSLCTVKACLFKEDFDHLWTYTSAT